MFWAYTIETGTMETQPLQETACWETTTTAENRVELCYNWNRYYDPRLGVYLSTDTVVEISRGMFLDRIHLTPSLRSAYVYAIGMPSMLIDPSGLYTFGFGGYVDGGAGIGGSGSNLLVEDGHGNIANTYTVGGGYIFGAAGSGGFRLQGTTADSVKDLQGLSLSIGGSACFFVCVGLDGTFFEDPTSIFPNFGISIDLGFGGNGAEGHAYGEDTAVCMRSDLK